MKQWLTCCSRGILIFLLTTILLLTASAAWAQATAQLNGSVRDETGAVLPGVTVTVTQTNTGLVRSTVSDENGAYLLTNLPTGPYRLEAALQGFRSYVQTGIVLQVGATPTVNAVTFGFARGRLFFARVALRFTRSGSFCPPVSRFHSSYVSLEIFPSTSSWANFRR